LNIIETNNLFEQLESLREEGYKILCADLNGEDIFQFSRPDKSIIVFSNEAHGPSPGILSISDYIITIPGKGEAESLNVASASAVIISQLTRQ
jgi:TrmH family RNA methyltransferase